MATTKMQAMRSAGAWLRLRDEMAEYGINAEDSGIGVRDRIVGSNGIE